MNETKKTCLNCNNQFVGNYCNKCGEKVYSEKDKTVKSLWKEATHFLTHFEGNFFISIKAIFTQPGKLSADFCRGIRKKYFKPISLFLICIVLYLLFPRFQGLNMKFTTYVNKDYAYAWYATSIAKNKMSSHNLTIEELNNKYNSKSSSFAKPMLLLLLPLSALFLWLLHFYKRRPFFDHFILATEINIFIIAFSFLITPLLMSLLIFITPTVESWFYDEGPVMYFELVVSILMSTFAIHRFYNEKWWIALLKGVSFVMLFNLLIQDIYKAILYLAVMLFI